MMLAKKVAVIYGAGGSLGGAVARAFAREGATVYLSGRTLPPITKLAQEIAAGGAKAKAMQVDALDGQAVAAFIDHVRGEAASVDISFDAIGLEDKQDVPLVEMQVEDFTRPIAIAMQTQFLTATAAARVMMKQRGGVILSLTATPGGIGYPLVGGFGPACCAIEAFTRGLASEVGAYGVRVVNLRSAGSPDSRVFKEAIAQGGDAVKAFMKALVNDTMLKQMPMIADIANVAAFVASDLASKITGVTVDVTAGTTAALNYKAPTSR